MAPGVLLLMLWRHPYAVRKPKEYEVQEPGDLVRVESGGPADHAGIRKDDVIVALDGQPTPSFLAMQRLLLAQFKVGQRINVTVARGKEQKQLTLTLGEFSR